MNITVDTSAIEKFHHQFSKFADSVPAQLKKTTAEATDDLRLQVPPYPPKPRQSTYIRTGKLGRSIKSRVEVQGTSIIGRLQSKGVKYAPYVIDEKHQAWMHKGRWWTLQEVLSGNMNRVRSHFSKMFEELWSQIYSGHRTY